MKTGNKRVDKWWLTLFTKFYSNAKKTFAGLASSLDSILQVLKKTIV